MWAAFSSGRWRVTILRKLLWFMGKNPTFAIPLPNSIRVVRKILDLYVLVRIQVGQQFYVHALKPALTAGFGVQCGWKHIRLGALLFRRQARDVSFSRVSSERRCFPPHPPRRCSF